MAVGCYLPSGVYLSVASPPSRDADTGFTMFGWFHVPTYAAGQFYSTLLLNYATNDVGEGFQFEASSATQSQGFVMCYPPNYTEIGGTYTAGTWYFQAEVYTRSAGVTTRRTYISTTAGATPTLISTQTWTVADASPERFDLGEAVGYSRSLRGTFQYVGVVASALSLAQLAEQSNSATPTVSCWVFISGENGTYVDSSGNSRTVTATGTPTTSTVSAPLVSSGAMAAGTTVSAALTASAAATGTLTAGASIGVSLSASTVPVANLTAGTAFGVSAAAGLQATGTIAATTNISARISSAATDSNLPRIICFGNSVTAGYGVSDPALHYPEQLKGLLGDRVESVIKLGYSGVTTATLDAQFDTYVGPYIDSGRRCIIIWQEVFNSAHSGVAANAIMTSYWSVCAKARAAGCEVIAQDTSAADADSQAHPEVVATCNAAMESQWPSHADGFVQISDTFYNPSDTTLYQSDGAHFTPTGLHALAELAYAEVDRLLLGEGFQAELGAGASIGVAASTAAAGVGTVSSGATVGLALNASAMTVGQIGATASIGLGTSAALSGIGSAVANSTISAATEASTIPLSPMVASATISAEAAAQSAGYGVLASNAPISVWATQEELEYEPGPLFASFDTSLRLSGGLVGSGAMAASLAVGMSASSRFSAPYVRPFDAYAQVIGDGLIGSTLLLTCTLTDATGAPIDAADAEVHVFSNGVQTSVIRRSSGAISRDPESGEYAATLVPADETLAMFCWHFPALAQRAAPVTKVIRGPALTEPT